MFNNKLQKSFLFRCMNLFMMYQNTNKEIIFKQLTTDVEQIDITFNIMMDQSEKIVEIFKYWITNDKYFRAIKFTDSVNTIQELYNIPNEFNQFISQFNLFVLIQTQQGTKIIFNDVIMNKVTCEYIKRLQGPNILTFIIPFSNLEESNQQNYYSTICKLINCIYITNTITFKWISHQDLQHLENQALYSVLEFDIVLRTTRLNDFITWDELPLLNSLLSLLSLQDKYDTQNKQYRTFFEFFDEPKSIVNELQIYTGACCVQLEKTYNFYVFKGDTIKSKMLFVKIKNKLNINLSQKYEEILFKYCKSKQNIMIILSSPETINEKEFTNLCQENPKLFKTDKFKAKEFQNNFLINKVTELYLTIQDSIPNSLFNNLQIEEKQKVEQQFKTLLVQNFIIKKL
ncbi:hypothetical protein pb186bvf_010568 [Paramecium bursaria]